MCFAAGVRDMLEKGGFHDRFDKSIMFPTTHDAVLAALDEHKRDEYEKMRVRLWGLDEGKRGLWLLYQSTCSMYSVCCVVLMYRSTFINLV